MTSPAFIDNRYGNTLASALSVVLGMPGLHSTAGEGAPDRPDALILFNPAVVMAPVEGVSEPNEALAQRFARPLETLSPYHHLAAGHPPTLVLHGSGDTVVPADTAVAYCDRIASLGGDCEIVLYGGAPHGFFNREPHFERTLRQMLGFLARIGWL